ERHRTKAEGVHRHVLRHRRPDHAARERGGRARHARGRAPRLPGSRDAMIPEPAEWRAADAAQLLRVPGPHTHKYSRGVLGVRTGSAAYPGAAVLGVEAAWRTGVG